MPGLVTASDTETATVTCDWTTDLAGTTSRQFTVGIRVGGRYVRDASGEDAVVTVSKPVASSTASGKGTLLGSASSGQYPGDAGKKIDVDFSAGVTASKLQGDFKAVVRNGTRVYEITSTAVTSVAIRRAPTSVSPATATLTGTASIQDVTNPKKPLPVAAGAAFGATMTDLPLQSQKDTIAITVYNRPGGLLFSSNWGATSTLEQALADGKLTVK